MCGVVGFVGTRAPSRFGDRFLRALARLSRRGPDDAGYAFLPPNASALTAERAVIREDGWILNAAPGLDSASLAIGHTRFSIVELSRLGGQPMLSPDGQLALTFNGEIYNHAELRAQLEGLGHAFRSHSDTEVLLHAYMQWGEAAFVRLVGWWAIALYDGRRRAVLLARDRLGKAPLYLSHTRDGLAWASEIGALLTLTGETDPQPRWASIHDFVHHALRDAHGHTSFAEVTSLEAASYMWVGQEGESLPVRYWRLPQSRLTEKDISVAEAVGLVRSTLMQATELRLQADVPVALQLSGGLDSSVVLACAAVAGRPVQAVTVSFPEPEANEDRYAIAAAQAFPGQVHQEFVTPGEAISIEMLADYTVSMGEPFHSPNQVANRLIWRRLRELGYKAALYGAGGDEVFAGYYGQYYVPYLRDRLLKGDLAGFASNLWFLSERRRTAPDLIRRLAILAPGGPPLFNRLRRGIAPARAIYAGGHEGSEFDIPWRLESKLVALMGDMRMNYWLRTDNQNSMQAPLELRSPFLDHRVVEAAFTLPVSYLVRDGWMKWILRKAFEKDLPSSVIWRREKMGFPFPLQAWLTANAPMVARTLKQTAAPHVRTELVDAQLGYNIRRDPEVVWRTLSYSIWWSQRGRIAAQPGLPSSRAVKEYSLT